jgi:hypothetical protein
MNIDLAGSFSLAARGGVSNWDAVDALILSSKNTVGADLDELLDYFVSSVYLRIFGEWENFLEQACVLGLAGRAPNSVKSQYVPILPVASLSEARDAVYGGNDYLLWHNPEKVCVRLGRHYTSCLLSKLIQAKMTEIEWYASIRHSIAHQSEDARRKFESHARSNMARGFTYGPGRVLRSRGSNGVPWISTIVSDLERIAKQAWPTV